MLDLKDDEYGLIERNWRLGGALLESFGGYQGRTIHYCNKNQGVGGSKVDMAIPNISTLW